MNLTSLTLIIALSLTASVMAGPAEDKKIVETATALAIMGDVRGQALLGAAYYAGKGGLKRDYVKALEWLRKAAAQGHPHAPVQIGNMYNDGKGVPQDYAQAVGWYRKAAEQGDADGQGLLGMAFALGEGVPKDYVEAHKWASLAASQGYAPAKQLRDLMARWMTPAQIAEAQRLAREWKPKK